MLKLILFYFFILFYFIIGLILVGLILLPLRGSFRNLKGFPSGKLKPFNCVKSALYGICLKSSISPYTIIFLGVEYIILVSSYMIDD